MNLLLYMAPIAVLLLLPATIFMEENVVGITVALAREDFKIIVYLLFNSCLAYFVNLTNFLVTKHTSALTLQVRVIGRSFFYYFFCITLLKYEFIPVHLIADFSLILFSGKYCWPLASSYGYQILFHEHINTSLLLILYFFHSLLNAWALIIKQFNGVQEMIAIQIRMVVEAYSGSWDIRTYLLVIKIG